MSRKLNKVELSKYQQAYLLVISLFFAAMPVRVFIAISSDVIQVAVIIIPFVLGFMILMLSLDVTFGLPVPPEALNNLSKRRDMMSKQLLSILRFGLALILVTIIAKSLAIWFIGRGWPGTVLIRFAAWTVGGLIAVLFIRVEDIWKAFGHLSVGADIAMHVRANRSDRPT